MTTYLILADVRGDQFQNPQELATIWGSIRSDVDALGGDLVDSYAVLGQHDFFLIVEADDPEAALQIGIAIERYGLETHTMQAHSIDRLGDLVGDI